MKEKKHKHFLLGGENGIDVLLYYLNARMSRNVVVLFTVKILQNVLDS